MNYNTLQDPMEINISNKLWTLKERDECIMLLCFFQKEEQKRLEPPLTKPQPLEPEVIISNYSESSENCTFDDGTDDDANDD